MKPQMIRDLLQLDAGGAHVRSILATVPDAMIVIDERGQILSFSAAAEKMFGYREDEVVGKNIKMMMPSPDRDRHDEVKRCRTGQTEGQQDLLGCVCIR